MRKDGVSTSRIWARQDPICANYKNTCNTFLSLQVGDSALISTYT